MVAMPSKNPGCSTEVQYYDFLAGAHLVEAAYDAWAEDPTNPQVKISIERGIPVMLADSRSPPDVQRYLKLDGNSLDLIASATSLMEGYNIIEEPPHHL